MNKLITSTAVPTRELKLEAIANISASFELLCLASGMEALGEMMEHDAQAICGPRHARGPFRRAHRWGKTKGKMGFHGGNTRSSDQGFAALRQGAGSPELGGVSCRGLARQVGIMIVTSKRSFLTERSPIQVPSSGKVKIRRLTGQLAEKYNANCGTTKSELLRYTAG